MRALFVLAGLAAAQFIECDRGTTYYVTSGRRMYSRTRLLLRSEYARGLADSIGNHLLSSKRRLSAI